MSKLVKELIKKSYSERIETDDCNGGAHIEHYFDEDKFANLIIEECIRMCNVVANMAEITNSGEMARKTRATAVACSTMIKEHFEITELSKESKPI